MARHHMHRIFDNFGRSMSLPDTDIYDVVSGLFTSEFVSQVQLELQRIRQAIQERNTFYIVETITDRNNLSRLVSGNMCFVKDATEDSTVAIGSASYIARVYIDNIVWDKVFETESLDKSLRWDMIQNKPESAIEDIDNMVSKVHENTNNKILKNISVNDVGNLVFNSVECRPYSGVVFKQGDNILGSKLSIVSEIIM